MNQRESFESFAAKGYQKVEEDILRLLDGFQEQEALAILERAKATVGLRDAWILKSNPICKQLVEKNRG